MRAEPTNLATITTVLEGLCADADHNPLPDKHPYHTADRRQIPFALPERTVE
jgi:hypothetical protein